MKPEEKTIKKIQELVFSIMELKKGCEVSAFLCKDDEPIDDYPIDRFIIGKKDKIERCKVGSDTYIIHNQKEYILYEILGRDIFLEDVLLVIGNKYKFEVISGGLYRNKIAIRKIVNKKNSKFVTYWIPNKPFHEQSRETKDFIGDLLLVE